MIISISPQNQKDVLVGIEKPCRNQALLATIAFLKKIFLGVFFCFVQFFIALQTGCLRKQPPVHCFIPYQILYSTKARVQSAKT